MQAGRKVRVFRGREAYSITIAKDMVGKRTADEAEDRRYSERVGPRTDAQNERDDKKIADRVQNQHMPDVIG